MYTDGIGVSINTKRTGPLTITGLLPESEDKCHGSEIFQANNVSWLVKVWKSNAPTHGEKEQIETRYKTFCNLNFDRERELFCLPQEYVLFNNRPAYVMKRAEGEEMGDGWNKLKGLHLLQRMRVARNVAAAISIMHSKQISHSDIRLSNFFFDPKTYQVNLLDLDGGGYWGAEKETTQFLPTARFVGPYTPPEFAKVSWNDIWRNPVTRVQPDLWALAVLIFQLLTIEQDPFPGKLYRTNPGNISWPPPDQMGKIQSIGIDNKVLTLFKQVFYPDIHNFSPSDFRYRSRPAAAHWKLILDDIIKHQAYITCPECQSKIEDLSLVICPRCAGRNMLVYLWSDMLCSNCHFKIPMRSPFDPLRIIYCPKCGKEDN